MAKFDEDTVDIELLCGVLNEDGSLEKSCTIKSMTGGLRKKVAQPEMRKDGYKIINAVLDACVVSVGGNPFTPSREAKRLLMADSDYLLLKIRQLSLGDHIDLDLKCPACGNSWGGTLEIGDIECFPMDDDDFKIEDFEAKFNVKTENWDCTVRLPNCEDQKIIAKLAQNNPIAAQHQMYARTILTSDGKKVDGKELMKQLDGLPVKYIDELTDGINENLPGGDFS